ncbi:hypothetical protein C8J56DRAFT_1057560 [Mycena floridula]|nr:hypothetical protein C8J56DRAFT_466623 [Mycena floridula]KAJ7580598.1 hypothetical protein C8J56DRAFT_1057560 [Mycena floridula]
MHLFTIIPTLLLLSQIQASPISHGADINVASRQVDVAPRAWHYYSYDKDFWDGVCAMKPGRQDLKAYKACVEKGRDETKAKNNSERHQIAKDCGKRFKKSSFQFNSCCDQGEFAGVAVRRKAVCQTLPGNGSGLEVCGAKWQSNHPTAA